MMIESFAKEIFNTFSVDHFVNPFSRVSVVLAPYFVRIKFIHILDHLPDSQKKTPA